MLGQLKKLLKVRSTPDFLELIKGGALIVDVRPSEVYAKMHLAGSLNIPVDKLPGELMASAKDIALIVCCATGIRSSVACKTLVSMGYSNVYDGGIWNSLKKYENEYRAQLRS